MNVYLYQNNTEKILKNVYIGEYVPPQYLCFIANTAGSTVKLKKSGSPTSVNLETSANGKNWSAYTIGDTITLSNVGDKVYMRNTSETDTGFSSGSGNYYQFVMTGSIAGSGDITSLINKNLTDTLPDYCYFRLFQGCTALTLAPSLPASTLAKRCYQYMFNGCTSLTTSPKLPAITLAQACYTGMFYNCTSLTTVPKLPITTLVNNCYSSMFYGCSNLTTLPALPATTLAESCYRSMFSNCSKIKLSTSQTGEYQTPYRIPTTGTGTVGTDSLSYMFYQTGGTFSGTPSINTTYYTSNTVV